MKKLVLITMLLVSTAVHAETRLTNESYNCIEVARQKLTIKDSHLAQYQQDGSVRPELAAVQTEINSEKANCVKSIGSTAADLLFDSSDSHAKAANCITALIAFRENAQEYNQRARTENSRVEQDIERQRLMGMDQNNRRVCNIEIGNPATVKKLIEFF